MLFLAEWGENVSFTEMRIKGRSDTGSQVVCMACITKITGHDTVC